MVTQPEKCGFEAIISLVSYQVNVNGSFQGQNVRIRPKTRYDTTTDGGNQRFVTEFFSSVNVGKVDLDGGDIDRRDGIPESHTGVGISCGIQDYEVMFAKRLLNPSHQLAFNVRLPAIDLRPHAKCPVPNLIVYLGEGRRTVGFRFARSKQVQVWAVQDKDVHRRRRN